MMNKINPKALIAEFIGTFALVFFGAGAAAISGDLVAIALAHGLILAVLVVQFGHISGTHVNPAITTSLLVGKKIDIPTAVSYIATQFLGAILAGVLLFLVIPASSAGNYGATTPATGVEIWQALLLEAILTFFLASSVYQAAVKEKGGAITPLIIGFTLAAAIMMGGPLTGASLNPARTLGPLISDFLNNLKINVDAWINFVIIYILGPLLGGFIAALVHSQLLPE